LFNRKRSLAEAQVGPDVRFNRNLNVSTFFGKTLHIKFHKNLFTGSGVVACSECNISKCYAPHIEVPGLLSWSGLVTFSRSPRIF
jgi:hypothetical protein